jgi:hypothetical protein
MSTNLSAEAPAKADALLTPEDRLRAVSAILAEGYLRLTRGRRNRPPAPDSGGMPAPENSQETLRNSLEPFAQLRRDGPLK